MFEKKLVTKLTSFVTFEKCLEVFQHDGPELWYSRAQLRCDERNNVLCIVELRVGYQKLTHGAEKVKRE